jgi:hypothetical protein
VPVYVIPQLAISIGNATEARAVDFRFDAGNEGTTRAVVLVTKTLGDTYQHDYSVCARFHGYTLKGLMPIPLSNITPWNPSGTAPWFWYSILEKDEISEAGLMLAIFVSEAQQRFIIDSRWITSEYACHFRAPYSGQFDYVLNYQIWASPAEDVSQLLKGIFARLSAIGPSWDIGFDNTAQPTIPTLAMTSASLSQNSVALKVQSWLPTSRLVRFYGTKRLCDACQDISFEFWRHIDPGLNLVKLALGNIANAVVYSAADGFVDKIFVSTQGANTWAIHSIFLPAVARGPSSSPPAQPSLAIEWPQNGASVTVERDLTNAVDDYSVVIHGTVQGMLPGWTISLDVFTNDWYPQAQAIVQGELWSAKVNLGGQNQYNNHTIRATLRDENNMIVTTAIVERVVRLDPCQTQ